MLSRTLRERLHTWVDQAYDRGPFEWDEDPRTKELKVLLEGDLCWEELGGRLDELRTEYIDQLASRFGSEPLVKRLVFLDTFARGPGD